MSQTSDSATSLIITVVFLVLISIATVLYGGSAEQKAKLNNNVFWQKTSWIFNAGLYALGGLTNLGTGQAANKNSSETDNPAPTVNSETDSSFWSQLSASFKDAWNKSGETATNNPSLTTDEPLESPNNESSLNWVKNASGAEIVFKAKSGKEYKLPLPFKFLSK
jgi:hypothetical protein